MKSNDRVIVPRKRQRVEQDDDFSEMFNEAELLEECQLCLEHMDVRDLSECNSCRKIMCEACYAMHDSHSESEEDEESEWEPV